MVEIFHLCLLHSQILKCLNAAVLYPFGACFGDFSMSVKCSAYITVINWFETRYKIRSYANQPPEPPNRVIPLSCSYCPTEGDDQYKQSIFKITVDKT